MADISNAHTLREWAVTTFEPLKDDAKLRSEMTTEKAAKAFVQWVAQRVEESHETLHNFADSDRNAQEEKFLATLEFDIAELIRRIHDEEVKLEVDNNDAVAFIERFLEHFRRLADQTGKIDWFNQQSMEWEAEAYFISKLVGRGTDAWVTNAADTLQKGDNMTSEQVTTRRSSFSDWLDGRLRNIREEHSREVLFNNWIMPQLEGMTRSLGFIIECAKSVTSTSVAEKTPYEVWLGLMAQSANMAVVEDRFLTEEDLDDMPWYSILAATEKGMVERILGLDRRSRRHVSQRGRARDDRPCLDDAYNVLLEKGLANGNINQHDKEQVVEWFQVTYHKIEEAMDSVQGEVLVQRVVVEVLNIVIFFNVQSQESPTGYLLMQFATLNPSFRTT
ncbi:hypothetical protein EDB81DRAFT_758557 [Dactylonectria macrodidyma]|uniref:Uncharacterized protein n=1 Tax=Dactylonectria macrodidyma TaxID=307937 RepID=A0A9P9JE24_9HYPO|nr:hypothetical protein EDB81DRAFT_758557 [Dactylonectria macrodidyma]